MAARPVRLLSLWAVAAVLNIQTKCNSGLAHGYTDNLYRGLPT